MGCLGLFDGVANHLSEHLIGRHKQTRCALQPLAFLLVESIPGPTDLIDKSAVQIHLNAVPGAAYPMGASAKKRRT